MASVNKVILMGRVGRDPEVRHMASGSAVCTIALATSQRRKDRSTGESVEETQWHRITLFERQAEVAGEYLRKGSEVYFEGRIKYGKYTDKDGNERPTTDIIATEMVLMGTKQTAQAEAPKPPPPPKPAPKPAPVAFSDMDDSDIPF